MFPQQFGQPFPPNFMEVAKTIYKRLFRVYGHIYHHHFKQVSTRSMCAALSMHAGPHRSWTLPT